MLYFYSYLSSYRVDKIGENITKDMKKSDVDVAGGKQGGKKSNIPKPHRVGVRLNTTTNDDNDHNDDVKIKSKGLDIAYIYRFRS